MHDTFVQALIGKLKDIDVPLPRHRRALRSQLLAAYEHQRMPPTHRLVRFLATGTGAPRQQSITKNAWGSGALVAVSGILLISLVFFRPAAGADRAHLLAAIALQKARQFSPAQMAEISSEYEALDTCLEEAIRSGTLHIGTQQEVSDLLTASSLHEYPHAETYLVYTNEHHSRVVVALGSDHQPLYVTEEHAPSRGRPSNK